MEADPTPLIGLEEHYLSRGFFSSDLYCALYEPHTSRVPAMEEKLFNLSNVRLADMDAGGISIQIVSHAPGLRSLEECKAANNQLHRAILGNPTRLAGFAVLPVSDPEGCARELSRCVRVMGFKGALIDNLTAAGEYFTGPEYDCMWQAFEDCNVPCYIHPTWPTQEQMAANFADKNVPPPAVTALSTSTWGWHSDVASHIIKLFSAGVFDRFTKLKIILGHFGEMIPFMLDRIDLFCRRWKKHGRNFREVWSENFWVTTSGVWSVDPIATMLRNTSIDRILFSVDYPFTSNDDGKRWVQDLRASDLLDEAGIQKIAHRNAEILFGLKANQAAGG